MTLIRPIVICFALLTFLLTLFNVHEALKLSRNATVVDSIHVRRAETNDRSNDQRRLIISDELLSLKNATNANRLDMEAIEEQLLLQQQQQHELYQQQATSTGRSNRSTSLSQLRIGVYMTTNQSPSHMQFLVDCWPKASQTLPLLQNATLIYYTSASHEDVPLNTLRQMNFRDVLVYHYDEINIPPNSTFKQRDAKKQYGAKRAMVDPFVNRWFDQFDWIIRLNPDVLIRSDTWFIENMINPSVQAILHGYPSTDGRMTGLHSDFYAFRPSIYDQPHITLSRLQNHLDRSALSAEGQLADLLGPLLVNDTIYHGDDRNSTDANAPRVAWIPGVKRRGSNARMMGAKSPVVHIHSFIKYCPNYFNVTDGVWF
jgi:hypothetical protein